MDIKDFEPLFGNWTVDSFIGAGSFGKVYKIKREDYGAIYYSALKWISIPQDDTELRQLRYNGMDIASITGYYQALIGELTNEMQIMSRLRGHSNIVSYEDHQIIPKDNSVGYDVFIRMELLTSLNEHILGNNCTNADVIRLGIDICNALEICQRYNIIHRDIKPDNIFLSETGSFKLGDFGIARQLEHTVTELSKKGTYLYMAPEVYKAQQYDSTVDLYSLGIVMYRLLNGGRVPFLPLAPNPIMPSDNEKSMVRRMSGESMPKPQNAGVRLAEIILKACAYNPRDRYSSPKQMREELQAIQFSKEEESIVFRDKGKLGYFESSSQNRETHPELNLSQDTVSKFEDKPDTEKNEQRESGTINLLSGAPKGETDNEKGHENENKGDNPNPKHEKKEEEYRKMMKTALLVLVAAVLIALIWLITSLTKDRFSSAGPETTQSIVMEAESQPTLEPVAMTPQPAFITPEPTATATLEPVLIMRSGIVAAGAKSTLLLRSDGTVLTYGNTDIDTSGWHDIVQVAANGDFAVGLKSDGTCVASGDMSNGEGDVYDWRNVVQVACGYKHTIAVTSDGTVYFTGTDKYNRSDCRNWSHVKKVLAGSDHVAGILDDGTVVSAGYPAVNRLETGSFRDVVDGDIGAGSTYCVLNDGTVRETGEDFVGEDNIEGWTDIVAIASEYEHTVGLRADGTVIAIGSNNYGECDTTEWTDIVAIAAGSYHTVGVRVDGRVLVTGSNSSGQGNADGVYLW